MPTLVCLGLRVAATAAADFLQVAVANPSFGALKDSTGAATGAALSFTGNVEAFDLEDFFAAGQRGR